VPRARIDAELKCEGRVPLYEYECKSCHHNFEKIQKFSDPPQTTCPKCGQETVEQVLSAPAVQFKGSGWYVTDYAKKSSGSGSSNVKSSDSKSETKPDSKSESKSETKSGSSSSDKK
jgi:putative FmdB family regulatory protein